MLSSQNRCTFLGNMHQDWVANLAEILAAGEALDQALALLEAGDIVAIPTETVYGLAGDATNGKAVARIFEAKGRPRFNPLIAHVSGIVMANEFRSEERRVGKECRCRRSWCAGLREG